MHGTNRDTRGQTNRDINGRKTQAYFLSLNLAFCTIIGGKPQFCMQSQEKQKIKACVYGTAASDHSNILKTVIIGKLAADVVGGGVQQG